MVQPPYDRHVHPTAPNAAPPQQHAPYYPPPPQQPYPQPHPYPAAPPRPKSSNRVALTIGLVIAGLFLLQMFWRLASMAFAALTVDTGELATRSETLVRECAGAGAPIECSIAAGSANDGVFTKDLRDRIAHWEAKHGALAAVDGTRGCQRAEGFGYMATAVVTATFGTDEQVLRVTWMRIPDTEAWTAMSIDPVSSLAIACE